MGLTSRSVGADALGQGLQIRKKAPDDYVIALVGNPNVGKSTVFNALTGMNQHTGNWPGKTVCLAEGRYEFKGKGYILIDLPGTYSLISKSSEEQVATEFILGGEAQCAMVVCDGTCLERNLILVLQMMELTDNLILCVNLMDEVEKKCLKVDLRKLQTLLGVPVVGIAAGKNWGLDRLREIVREVKDGFLEPKPRRCLGRQEERSSDKDAKAFVRRAEEIAKEVTLPDTSGYCRREERIDHILAKPLVGIPLMCLFLLAIFWLTIQGANYPSQLLQRGFDRLGLVLDRWLEAAGAAWWIKGCLLDGVYATAARVISVMLPPMAIFFPLFTLIEDFGFLPRIAFLMDGAFQKCGTCGKQALTMCMGFGCNAAGVVGCRIIDSPRERLIAILTNSLIPCNGRFPALIVLITVFLTAAGNAALSACILAGVVLFAVAVTMLASKLLSSTVLKGEPSSFTLELPPFRRPKIMDVIVRSVFDRTLYILGRAVAVAAPAGLVIWILANVQFGTATILQHLCVWLDPLGLLLGMNGAILLGFILGLPANELVIPVILMCLTAGGLSGADAGTAEIGRVLLAHGWTIPMAICTMVFFLFHWPCSTTCLTIYKETKSLRWTALAVALPTIIGAALCGLLHLLFVFLGLS